MDDSRSEQHGGGSHTAVPPIAVLCDLNYPENTRSSSAHRSAVSACVAPLEGIDPFAVASERQASLVAATHALRALAEELKEDAPDGTGLSATSLPHEYFRIRTARLNPAQELAATAQILTNVVTDLTDAAL